MFEDTDSLALGINKALSPPPNAVSLPAVYAQRIRRNP